MSGKFLRGASALSLAILLTACGGDDSSAPIVNVGTGGSDSSDDTGSGDTDTGSDTGTDDGDTTTPGDDDTTTETLVLLGTGKGSSFVESQLFATAPTIDVNEPLSFGVTLADPETKNPLIKSGHELTFTSRCLAANGASISSGSTDAGEVEIQYVSTSCYGEDTLYAFINESTNPAATGTITINEPETLDLNAVDYDPENNSYTAVGSIFSTADKLPQYGQARLTVGIIDINGDGAPQTAEQLIKGTSFTVNFESFCAKGLNTSSFEPTEVSTETGIAETIFTAGSCGNKNPQEITATVVDEEGNEVATASTSITVDSSNAFQLVAALPDPMSIAPSSLSTEGRETVSTITFTLKDQNNEVLGDNEAVTFTIDDPELAEFKVPFTDDEFQDSITVQTIDGVATALVRAKEGVDHTEFRVIAEYGDLLTYSMPIVVNSQLPWETRFSLSADNFSPNVQGINGIPVSITVYAADIEGIRVRDNTTVNFRISDEMNHGSIDPECVISEGVCTVTWQSLWPENASIEGGTHATIIASTHGLQKDGNVGTLEADTKLLMSTNDNIHLDFVRNGDLDADGTEYCATTWVYLPDQGATMFSPPVGTTISFEVDKGEITSDGIDSETIVSKGSLVSDDDGYEVCTTVKPEVDEEVIPTAYEIEITAKVETPDGGATAAERIINSWTD